MFLRLELKIEPQFIKCLAKKTIAKAKTLLHYDLQ